MGASGSGKDATVVFPVNPVIRDVLHNGIGYLFIDEPNDLCDKLFRIVPEHIELIFPQFFQNGDPRPPGQHSALGHLADEVIRKMAGVDFLQSLGAGPHISEGIPAAKLTLVHFVLLAAHGCGILQLREK